MQIPKDLVASIYKMVASRKTINRCERKNNNYECRIRKCKDDDEHENSLLVKRKSNLFDRYSSEGQQNVERRRKRTLSGSNERSRAMSLTINNIQEICMVDMKTQLLELTKKINKLVEISEARLNVIEQTGNI